MNAVCEEVQRQIPLGVAGDLDESARASLLTHAKGCAECRRALEFQRRLSAEMHNGPLPELSVDFYDGALSEVHERMANLPPDLRRSGVMQLLLTTLALALTAVVAAFWAGPRFAPDLFAAQTAGRIVILLLPVAYALLGAFTIEIKFRARHGERSAYQERLAEARAGSASTLAHARGLERELAKNTSLGQDERCALYHELADVYIDELGDARAASATLEGLCAEFPKSGHAVLARERIALIKGVEKAEVLEEAPEVESVRLKRITRKRTDREVRSRRRS